MANLKKPVDASAPVTEKKPVTSKIPKALADTMLAAGDITKEQYEKLVSSGRVTSGEGGGNPVRDQFVAAGVEEKKVEALFSALEAVNNALWTSDNKYLGKLDSEGREVEAAIWAKHYPVKK